MSNEEKQALLSNLEKALFSGHLKVKNGDKEIQYNSTSEMIKVRDILRVELGLVSKGSRRKFASHSKGLSEC